MLSPRPFPASHTQCGQVLCSPPPTAEMTTGRGAAKPTPKWFNEARKWDLGGAGAGEGGCRTLPLVPLLLGHFLQALLLEQCDGHRVLLLLSAVGAAVRPRCPRDGGESVGGTAAEGPGQLLPQPLWWVCRHGRSHSQLGCWELDPAVFSQCVPPWVRPHPWVGTPVPAGGGDVGGGAVSSRMG